MQSQYRALQSKVHRAVKSHTAPTVGACKSEFIFTAMLRWARLCHSKLSVRLWSLLSGDYNIMSLLRREHHDILAGIGVGYGKVALGVGITSSSANLQWHRAVSLRQHGFLVFLIGVQTTDLVSSRCVWSCLWTRNRSSHGCLRNGPTCHRRGKKIGKHFMLCPNKLPSHRRVV